MSTKLPISGLAFWKCFWCSVIERDKVQNAEPVGTERLIRYWRLPSIFCNSVWAATHRGEPTNLHSRWRASSSADVTDALPYFTQPTLVVYNGIGSHFQGTGTPHRSACSCISFLLYLRTLSSSLWVCSPPASTNAPKDSLQPMEYGSQWINVLASHPPVGRS